MSLDKFLFLLFLLPSCLFFDSSDVGNKEKGTNNKQTNNMVKTNNTVVRHNNQTQGTNNNSQGTNNNSQGTNNNSQGNDNVYRDIAVVVVVESARFLVATKTKKEIELELFDVEPNGDLKLFESNTLSEKGSTISVSSYGLGFMVATDDTLYHCKKDLNCAVLKTFPEAKEIAVASNPDITAILIKYADKISYVQIENTDKYHSPNPAINTVGKFNNLQNTSQGSHFLTTAVKKDTLFYINHLGNFQTCVPTVKANTRGYYYVKDQELMLIDGGDSETGYINCKDGKTTIITEYGSPQFDFSYRRPLLTSGNAPAPFIVSAVDDGINITSFVPEFNNEIKTRKPDHLAIAVSSTHYFVIWSVGAELTRAAFKIPEGQ